MTGAIELGERGRALLAHFFTQEHLEMPCLRRNTHKTKPEAHPQSERGSQERMRGRVGRRVLRNGQRDRSRLFSHRKSL